MSLLLQALQKAARNREQATAAAPDAAAAAPSADNRSMLELEPGEFDPGRSIGQDPARAVTESPTLAPAAGDPLTLETPAPSRAAQRPTFVDGVDEPTPQQAAMLMNATSGVKEPGFSVIDWARERPVYVFAGAAFLFLAGYGAYVYIAITQPGLLSGGFTKPAPGAPIGPLTAAPRPPASAAPGNPASPAAPATAPLLPDVTKPSPVMPAAGTQAPVVGPAAPDPSAPPAAMSAPRQVLAAAPAGAADLPVLATPAPANPEPPARAEPRVPSSGITGPVAVATPSEAAPRKGRRRADATAAAPASRLEVRASAGAAAITTQLNDAYAASLKGESHTAQDSYERVLAADPRNVDAMLGLASIDWQAGRTEQASELYYRILQSEPQNAAAQAGLIGLVGRVDPVASETRLKLLIARDPAASLYFALGNLYSSQGQWAGAQRAYFQAVEADAGNPDYVFNLAVALEHIGQQKPALANYRKALDLSFARGSSFDQKQVIARIGQLSLAVE